jgi:hypothetical protein
MIELMEIIALVVGILFSFYWFKGSAEYILILLYLSPFRTKDKFEWLYDNTDDEVTYSLIGTELDGVKVYSDYYRLHQAAQPTSFKYFRRYYKSLRNIFLNPKSLIILAPALIFWAHWYLYLIGMFISIIGILIYNIVDKGYRIGFYQRLIILMVIKDYQKSLRKSK